MEKLGTLKPKGAYNFNLTLDLLRRYAHPALDVTHDDAYWRLLYGRGGLHLLRVTDVSGLEKPKLQVDLVFSTIEPDRAYLLDKMSHLLGVDHDHTPFYDYAQTHTALWNVVQPMIGLHFLRTETMFEALMMTIIEQQISWINAQRAQRWLVEWGGHKISYKGHTYYAFPRPGQLADATIDTLRPLKITFRRMQTMIDIAQQVYRGEIKLEKLVNKSPEKAYARLLALKGIGHWTAVWTLQRTLPEGHAYVGYNDVALQAAANHYFCGELGKLTPLQTRDLFAQFGPFAGFAANYTIMRWVLDRYAEKPMPVPVGD